MSTSETTQETREQTPLERFEHASKKVVALATLAEIQADLGDSRVITEEQEAALKDWTNASLTTKAREYLKSAELLSKFGFVASELLAFDMETCAEVGASNLLSVE